MIQKKYIIIAIVTFTVLCVLYFLLAVYPKIGKVPVEILAHPKDAMIYVDDRKDSTGTIYVRPGTHTFRAEKSGWTTDEVTVEISENLTTVALLPKPVSEEALQLVEDPDVALEREGLAGVAANARGLGIRNANPIINELPYSDISGPFKIDYGFNQVDKKTPYLIVSFSTPNGRQAAIQWLKDNGVDTTTTEIIFSGFINPLQKEEHTHE